MNNHELPKTYSPADFESRIYQHWCDMGYFTPTDDRRGKQHFSIVIPPPNITG